MREHKSWKRHDGSGEGKKWYQQQYMRVVAKGSVGIGGGNGVKGGKKLSQALIEPLPKRRDIIFFYVEFE